MKIAVAGGTGLVGRLVVAAARDAGHEPVVISRAKGVDVLNGAGLDGAMDGVDVVVDVLNAPSISKAKATAFFETTTHNLLTAEAGAGIGHHVALSIVNVDRVPYGYYQAKLRQEELIAAGDVPWTVLRATQFHEFAVQMLAQTKGPLAPVPRMRSATVAAHEVATRLVELAVAAPVGRVPNLSGPDVHEMPDLARRVLHATKRRRLVIPLPMPGAAGKAMAGGGLLPDPGGTVGTETFEMWLRGYARR